MGNPLVTIILFAHAPIREVFDMLFGIYTPSILSLFRGFGFNGRKRRRQSGRGAIYG